MICRNARLLYVISLVSIPYYLECSLYAKSHQIHTSLKIIEFSAVFQLRDIFQSDEPPTTTSSLYNIDARQVRPLIKPTSLQTLNQKSQNIESAKSLLQ